MSAYHSHTTSGVFIDPTTDPGFKILFGRESSKDILISLLNAILESDLGEPILDLTLMDKEKVRETEPERTVSFDIHCETNSGRRFIVEMQKIEQDWFAERLLFYASRAITEQSKSGEWDYSYKPVIGIALTNFTLAGFKNQPVVDVVPMDKQTHNILTDRLRLIFVQLPQFNQIVPEECDTILKEWIFTIKNMRNMESIPFASTNPIFRRVEELARKENLTPEERKEYERNEKVYRDTYNQIRFAAKKGYEQGVQQGIQRAGKMRDISIALAMIGEGLPEDLILRCTGLSPQELEELKTQ